MKYVQRFTLPRAFAFSFAIIVALGCAAAAAAQSGRRVPKSTPAPAVAPVPEPTPASVAASEQPRPVLQIVIGIERFDSFSSISIVTYDDVLRSCAQRLDEPQSVTVERVERSMSRSEASNRAKAEKSAYVVWLRVREDEMSSNTTGTPNNVYIEYVVFAPITSKVVSSGSAYPRKRVPLAQELRASMVTVKLLKPLGRWLTKFSRRCRCIYLLVPFQVFD